MAKLILLIAISLDRNAFAQTVCTDWLGTPKFNEYIAALVPTEVTRTKMDAAHRLVRDQFNRATLAMGNQICPMLNHVGAGELFRLGFDHFYSAVKEQVRGRPRSRRDNVRRALNPLNLVFTDPVDYGRLDRLALELSRRPEVDDTCVLETYYAHRGQSLTHALLTELTLDFSGTLSFGPREEILAREALRFLAPVPGQRVLQVNMESPGPLGVLKDFVAPVEFYGVTEGAVPRATARWAGRAGVSTSANDPPRLRYQMILALDGFGARVDALAPAAQLNWLRELAAAGGTVVLVYDNAGSPAFSARQATRAGFRLLRWGVAKKLPAPLAEVVYGPTRNQSAGQFRVFALGRR